ncbi:MAG: PAS domain-containing protein [Chloroflexota bacterium]|nr:PAS domain-containing protein [Chloroflexota bacterium]
MHLPVELLAPAVSLGIAAALGAVLFLLWRHGTRLRAAVAERGAHRLEHALRETHQLQAVVNGTTDAIFLKDLNRTFVVANEATAQFLGHPVSEILGRTAQQLLPRSAADEFDAAVVAAIADGVPVTREQEITLGAARKVWQTTLGPYRNEAGQVVGVFGVARDVTVQRTGEESLARSQALLAAAETIANLGSYEVELGTGIVRWSRQLQRMAQLEPNDRELTYERFLDIVHPDDRSRVAATIEGAIGRGADHAYEFRVPRADGTERVLSCQARIVSGPDGRPVRIFGTAQDVTDTRRLENEFLQAQKMEAVGQLAGGVAHDFNNALTAILGYSQILRASMAEGPEAEWVDQIDGAARHAAGLTRQLLAFSRRQILQPKVLDIARLVEEVAPMIRRLIGEDVNLVVSAEPDTGRVRADPGQLQQVLVNLAVNARDAMPQGGRLRISLSNADPDAQGPDGALGPWICLTVDDTGEGMDDSTKARVFEPFFTTKDVGKGTGLGLAMVHGFVTQSGGHISFDSERGRGTRFRILLPRIEAQAEPARVAATEPPRVAAVGLILLVEDDPMVRELTRLILETNGYGVVEATNGDEAIAALDRLAGIDLIISDVVMPGAGGGELAEAMKSRGYDIPIVFISGYPRDAVVAKGITDLEFTYLAKPFSPSQLLSTVREKLAAARPRVPVGSGQGSRRTRSDVTIAATR